MTMLEDIIWKPSNKYLKKKDYYPHDPWIASYIMIFNRV